MPPRFLLLTLKSVAVLVVAAQLLACGGGGNEFPPVVTGVSARTLQYSRTAVINIGGNDLRNSMTVDTGGACTNPSFAASSSTSLVVLNCTVVKVGAMPLTVKDSSGKVIYQSSLTVPQPQVTIATTITSSSGTSNGAVVVELDPAVAPVTVDNFLGYVNRGFYSNTLFHRVIPDFMVQGGGYTTGLVKKTGQLAPIVLESNKGLSNLRGTIAMARLGDDPKDPEGSANSATSEFFINVVDNLFLDYKSTASPGYAVFGKVVKGMDVPDAIIQQTTHSISGFKDVPVTDMTITSIRQTQ
ncbi:peptidylprolyl isomerase [Limnohabitans sp.]|uniref:peptidylprolyl isomerase n=1 Tax=Limnohabitans sp. TaxID=1907725 RepID=UPI003A4C50B3